MPRRLLAVPAVVLALALAGCTAPPAASPDPAPSPTASTGDATPDRPAGLLPACTQITDALGTFLDGLTYSAETSAANTADELYDQRVCVYVTNDAATQLGVTIAAIPFLQGELDAYATLPNAIADDRLTPFGGVLQTLAAGDGDDGHLDSALYLFDTAHSITIQGLDEAGGATVSTLPQLTLAAATDAAFAVRALIG